MTEEQWKSFQSFMRVVIFILGFIAGLVFVITLKGM